MESNINLYKLSQHGKDYILKMCLVGDSLRLSCKNIINPKIKYTRDFKIEELKQLDKVFNFILTPLQALQYINKILIKQKVKVWEEAELVKLQFYFESEETTTQTEIPLTTEMLTTTTNEYTSNYDFQNIQYDTANYDTNYVETVDTTNNYYNQNFGVADYSTPIENIDTTQYQEAFNSYNTYNEYQNTESIPTPLENYQVYDTTQNYEEYTKEFTTNIEQTNIETTPYITPVEETPVNIIQETKNFNSEIESLKAENQQIKQRIQQLSDIRNQAAEARLLQNQLYELDPLRRKAAETDMIKSQLAELESLKQKVNELSNAKNQLNEISNLKNEFEQINALKKEINELNNMKLKAKEDNELKERIKHLENINFQQEQEINALRKSQANTTKVSTGMESRQLFFEEKPEQICVKGDIIHNAQELELITRKINVAHKKLTLNLLYKATADSDKAEAFHNKCDKAQSSIVLIETDNGKRFGGFTSCSWAGDCVDKKDENAFIFSLDKMMTYDNIPNEEAIGCYPKFGPIFMGCQIRIYDNAFTKGGTTFEKGLNFNTEEDYELTGGDRSFNVKEIEVYEVVAS